MIILQFDLQPQFKYMNYFTYTSHHFTPNGRYELNKLASLPMCGPIAQLVEHRTGIAEVTGSNPVEALIFSGFFFPILGHIRILSIGLELACNGGSCGEISIKIDECNLHLKRFPRISLACKLKLLKLENLLR